MPNAPRTNRHDVEVERIRARNKLAQTAIRYAYPLIVAFLCGFHWPPWT